MCVCVFNWLCELRFVWRGCCVCKLSVIYRAMLYSVLIMMCVGVCDGCDGTHVCIIDNDIGVVCVYVVMCVLYV